MQVPGQSCCKLCPEEEEELEHEHDEVINILTFLQNGQIIIDGVDKVDKFKDLLRTFGRINLYICSMVIEKLNLTQ